MGSTQKYKIFYIAVILVIIFVGITYIYTKQTIENFKNQKYLEVSKTMTDELQTLIQEKSEAILLIAVGLSANNSLISMFEKRDVKYLDLNEFTLTLRKYTSLKNVWFQFIDSDGNSLYRSWTAHKGDNVASFRPEVANMLVHPEVTSLVSVGKYDLSFKSMVPVYNRSGEFLGILETMAKFHSIVAKMAMKGYDTLVLVDKKYKPQLLPNKQKVFIQNYYVVNPDSAPKLLDLIENGVLEEYLNIDGYKIDKERNILITLYLLKNIDGENMGYFILSEDLDKIDMSGISTIINKTLTVSIIIFFIVFAILYYIYIVNYKEFIQIQNRLLAKSVEDKTKELQEYSDKLYYLAHHDLLTNTPNRLLFLDRLRQQIKHAKRNGTHLGVLFMDLDRFKEINDTYGHEVGDKLLIEVASVLKSSIRSEDTVARLGGDEFTVLLVNTTQIGIIKIVEKIVQKMQEPFVVNGIELFTTFSIGISMYDQDGDTPDILLRNADTAMYGAKDNGRNSYQFYNQEMTELALHRIELDKSIRRALENDEFEPYFQPKIDARNGKVVGLEALIRWNDPNKGLVYPNDFIPFAQEVGLILDIDIYMFRSAMQKVLQLQKEGITTGVLSVNVSTKRLESQGFKRELKTCLDSIGYDPSLLELEILESQIMRDPKRSSEILSYVRDLGISISVDDFGTGYSSLSYLSRLPIDKLKIDRSFVKHIPEVHDDVAIVKTIISLAKNLNIKLIAEGVENKEQVEFLMNAGCNVIQGYYYSKPLSFEDCREYLISKSK